MSLLRPLRDGEPWAEMSMHLDERTQRLLRTMPNPWFFRLPPFVCHHGWTTRVAAALVAARWPATSR